MLRSYGIEGFRLFNGVQLVFLVAIQTAIEEIAHFSSITDLADQILFAFIVAHL